MRTIFAEYNPHRNSIDVYTNAGYMLRIDCWEEFTHDFCPFGISHYFKTIICADDTQEHKPNAAPILKYVELSKTDHRKVL